MFVLLFFLETPYDSSTGDQQEESLYDGARISLKESMLLIMTFLTRHELTKEATRDLLSLIELHCLVPNRCRTSTHLFYGFFGKMTSPAKKHYYCMFCQEYHGTENMPVCPVCNKKEQNFFMHIPLMSQLHTIFAGI